MAFARRMSVGTCAQSDLSSRPSALALRDVTNTLEVSLDYLVGKTSQEFDKATLKRIEDMSKLPDEVKAQIFQVMDSLIRDYKAKQAYS